MGYARECSRSSPTFRRFDSNGGQTYAAGYADACHEWADRLEAVLNARPRKARKWEAAIIAAIAEAGRPMRACDIVEQILGPPPHKLFNAVKSACVVACLDGVIVRIGSNPSWYRYTLPPAAAAVDPAAPK